MIAHYAALHSAEEQLALYRKIFENFSEAILITDSRRRIVAVNQAFTDITGYTLAETAGRRPGMLHADRTSASEYRSLWRAVQHRGQWQGEVWYRTKGGQQRPQWLSIRAVRDPHDAVSNYIAVFSDLTERKAEQDRISYLAQHDPLTGLPNRHLLGDRLSQAMASAARHGGQVALLFLDLDRFKVVNDSLGHRVGDLLLCSVAGRLKALLRQEDTVARIGGDEFVIVVPHLNWPDLPAHVAQKVIRAMREPHAIEGGCFTIGASVGISLFPLDGSDGDTLVRNADSAMYKAKARGGNCYEFYTANMTSRAMERLIVENSLRAGLERQEFVLFYQPQIDLSSGRIAGAEALIRWLHPELGVVQPDRFIPIAEETGLIIEIGDWVLRSACRQNKRWQQQGLAPIRVAVNVAARQCRPGFAGSVRAALAESGLEARFLELELTESTLMGDVGEILHQLKTIGVTMAIDDFGVGYSSLSYLKRFPFDNLKIDRSLIAEIGIGDRNSSIAGAAIALAHSLALTVTAEGAYAAWQARFLRERHCDLVQGFYFSRPVPALRFGALLRRGKPRRLRPGYIRASP